MPPSQPSPCGASSLGARSLGARSLALTCLAALLLGGCTADLRPGPLRERDRPQEEACGRELLAAAAARQHAPGARPWRSQPAVSVRFQDAYFGLIGALACPWPTDPSEVELTFTPGTDTSRARFSDSEGRAEVWGIHDWNTWSVRADGSGQPEYLPHPTAAFWLPTLQYFLELPFRIGEAEFADCAGPQTIDLEGKTTRTNRVYATWGSYTPHPHFDQYLAFVDAETGFLVRADFTVRDVAGFAKGRVLYRDFRRTGGYWLPHRIQIGTDPPSDMLHELLIKSYDLSPALEGLVPDPTRPPSHKP